VITFAAILHTDRLADRHNHRMADAEIA